jgi:hypothetical protein
VGLRDRRLAPALRELADVPFARSTSAAIHKRHSGTDGVKSPLAFDRLSDARLDTITAETIGGFIVRRRYSPWPPWSD